MKEAPSNRTGSIASWPLSVMAASFLYADSHVPIVWHRTFSRHQSKNQQEDCWSSGKTSTKGNLEAWSLRSFFVGEPPCFLLENVERKRWLSRYEKPLDVPFGTECWIWTIGKNQRTSIPCRIPKLLKHDQKGQMAFSRYLPPCSWVHKQQATFKWLYL